FLDIGGRLFEGADGEPQAHGGVAAALQIEGFHQLAEAARGHDHMLLRHADVVEIDVAMADAVPAHHLFLLAEAEARLALFHIYRADALGSRIVGHAAIDHLAVRTAAAAGPALAAVEHIACAVLDGARLEIGERRARIGLRHADRDLDLARADPGQH